MVTPNTNCKVCNTLFYVSPGHKKQGWGKYCSQKCYSVIKSSKMLIESNVSCKNCGNIFHVKPSHILSNKGKVYCSAECRIASTSEKKTCPQCKKVSNIPKSHANRFKFCSKKCRHDAALCSTNNCICKTCGTPFYCKPSEIKQKTGNGSFCSVKCMTRSRWKIKLEDGKYASYLEAALDAAIKDRKLDSGMVREYRFHKTRKWLLDFAWPDKKLGIEIQGGIWLGGRGGHTSGHGRTRDMDKLNQAQLLGWVVLQFSSNHIKSGDAIDLIEMALK